MFSERLTRHMTYKEKYPEDAAETAQGKRRSLAINLGIGHRLTREQYYDALGEDDIPEPLVYPQHPNTRLFPNAANYPFPRSYADRLEGWARYDPMKTNLENPLRSSKTLEYWKRHDPECKMSQNPHQNLPPFIAVPALSEAPRSKRARKLTEKGRMWVDEKRSTAKKAADLKRARAASKSTSPPPSKKRR